MKQKTLFNQKDFNLSGTSNTTNSEIVSHSEESYSPELLEFISYAESESKKFALSETYPIVSKIFEFASKRLYEPELDLKPYSKIQYLISLPDLPTRESDFWERKPRETLTKHFSIYQPFKIHKFQSNSSGCQKSPEYQKTQISGQSTLNNTNKTDSNLSSIQICNTPKDRESNNFEKDQKNNGFLPILDVIVNGSPTGNLEELIVQLLSHKIPSLDQIIILSPCEKILLAIYLNKRMLISDRQLKSFSLMSTDGIKISSVLSKLPERSNCNESGLTETILNRILRTCFEEWFNQAKKQFHIYNGRYKFRNKNVTNDGVNKLFWEHILSSQKGSRKRKLNFNSVYTRILCNVQIKKKKIKKGKHKKNISIRQPKYHNIFWKKKLKQRILKTLGGNPLFLENYHLHKSEVLFQYSSLPDPAFDVSDNSDSLFLSKNKFSFDLKKQVSKAISQIFEWIREKADVSLDLDGVLLKKKLKHIACPVTVEDHRVVFLEIEKLLCIK